MPHINIALDSSLGSKGIYLPSIVVDGMVSDLVITYGWNNRVSTLGVVWKTKSNVSPQTPVKESEPPSSIGSSCF
ncbi:hypothetical protein V6N11_014345 [Hibiscus sabdariffa]|uniref:Uncharacterized protein n=1 Tax=Hibiscus sabdariffa TaxID=183260 RepID=A0ABR1ZDE5_9ROSI